jgi:YVTN family beta-propeller protein
MRTVPLLSRGLVAATTLAALGAAASTEGALLPTGVRVTPDAAPGAIFQPLSPELPARPGFFVDHAASTALSPDGRTLLVLTSGYNRNNGADGKRIAAESNEYVFVFDVSGDRPVQRQVLQIANAYSGIAFHPRGDAFYVAGGVDDVVHVFSRGAAGFAESGAPIALGHSAGLGLGVRPAAAGIAVTADGARAVVANFENDSATVIDLASRATAEVQLRPGKVDPAQSGTPGGEYPFWVSIKGNEKAYVSSQRDGELVVIDLTARTPRVAGRIAVGAQPGKSILDRPQRRLFVGDGSSDTVSVVDTAADRVIGRIATTAPRELLRGGSSLKGANPNALALSADGGTLYVSNGGTNSVAVVRLGPAARVEQGGARGRDQDDQEGGPDRDEEAGTLGSVEGLIPTGWYPDGVEVAVNGRLHVINAKGVAGPNPGACRNSLSTAPSAGAGCNATNQYVWQLEKAGYLTLPIPSGEELSRLTLQVARNNRFPGEGVPERDGLMAFLREKIKHVVYVIKENRTYDQVLGDLDRGDGDPSLALFPERITPNHHALARNFVTLDRFLDSGETSGVGWNWTTAARTTDFTEKTQPVNYAGRGLSYDWEGTNRNVNVGYATPGQRAAANPATPADPDLLPGTADVASPRTAEGATAYLWSNALRHGLSVRNYGVFGDLAIYSALPLDRDPAAHGARQFFPSNAELQDVSDPYFRGYDNKLADYWRVKEWAREFDEFAARGELPAFEMVRVMHDHFGEFARAADGVNTPETQMADNDYAVGLIVEKISRSRFAGDTLIFIVEDDAQDGPDHVDAHRSIAYVLGPYVKRGAVVSTDYNTVNMVRTIEDVLGLPAQGLTDGLAEPMADVFTRDAQPWAYTALVPAPLRSTALPLPPAPQGRASFRPRHPARWWAAQTAGQDFSREDAIDAGQFNRTLWRGLKGEGSPYPTSRRPPASPERPHLAGY